MVLTPQPRTSQHPPTSTRKNILLGFQKNYVLCWDNECKALLLSHNEAKTNVERSTTATNLLTMLNTKWKERWTETVESIDFTHSSCQHWQTVNELTGQATKSTPCPITADAIAAQLISNGRFTDASKAFTRKTTGK